MRFDIKKSKDLYCIKSDGEYSYVSIPEMIEYIIKKVNNPLKNKSFAKKLIGFGWKEDQYGDWHKEGNTITFYFPYGLSKRSYISSKLIKGIKYTLIENSDKIVYFSKQKDLLAYLSGEVVTFLRQL